MSYAQHRHRRSYLVLRLNRGVLVYRSAANRRFKEQDLESGRQANATINIHWGGRGDDVRNWSEGCQVINGLYYTNHLNELIDCSGFVAPDNPAVNKSRSTTRGAYNVLLDLVTTLSGDTGSNEVKYTLLNQAVDYLVSNDAQGNDSYAVSKEKFESLCDPVDQGSERSVARASAMPALTTI